MGKMRGKDANFIQEISLSLVNETVTSMQRKKRILLGQLGSFGDCLYATTVARQIKVDFPQSHLTWAIGSPYRSILDNNPDVDDIWEVPFSNRKNLLIDWQNFKEEALKRKEEGEFDEVFLTQVFPGNLSNFDGTLRSSVFRAYPNPITVPVAPVLHLTDDEIENVVEFARINCLKDFAEVVLFECSPKSGQSFIDEQFAQKVARMLVKSKENICVILSSNTAYSASCKNIIDGSVLSFRENLKLIDYCSMVVGCSSGISWLATSASARKVPMIQLLEKQTSMYASFIHDFKFHGLEFEHIFEMTNCPPQKVVDSILLSFTSGFSRSKDKYAEDIPVRFYPYWHVIKGMLFKRQFKDAFKSIRVTYSRWGFRGYFLLDFLIVCFERYPRALYSLFRKKNQ